MTGHKTHLTRLHLERFFTAYQAACGSIRPPFTQARMRQFFYQIRVPLARAYAHRLTTERKYATRFNIFSLMDPDENKLSDVLVDLLDPKGRHGQGELFLHLMLNQLAFGWKTKALAAAKVERESATYALRHNQRRRIDIMVEAGFLLAIENKKASAEQPRQVKDYLAHLAHCAASNRLPYALIYLTPDHHLPPSMTATAFRAAHTGRHLVCWSYQRELRQWLELCRQQCRAPKIQHFLSDFITYTSAAFKQKGPENESEESYEC